jgi:mono/diheme cytochrome c family protein
MFVTNLKIAIVVVLTLVGYTLVANIIPQIESEVPEQLQFSSDVSVAELVGAGERIFNGAGGCTACHGLGTRAPNLLRSEAGLGPIGNRCAERDASLDCKTYLYVSLTEPGGYVVDGYSAIMPDARRTLSEDQIWALVAFLEAQGGEVTVTAQDLAGTRAGEPLPAAASSSATVSPAGSAKANTPLDLIAELGCLACHQLGEEGNAIGPALTDVGARRDAAYIRQSILQPGADISSGYEAFAALMPTDLGDRMTAAQLEALVEFLVAQR